MNKQQCIKVYVRVKPEAQESILTCSENKYILIDQTTQLVKQEFDYVFDQDTQQKTVFDIIEPTISQSLKGFNSTILAYGQTGSGKTHTMFGSDWEYSLQVPLNHQSTYFSDLSNDQNNAGVIPRCVYSLFQQLPQNYFIYCSFLQIYNEKIYDLLQDHKTPQSLQIHESKIDGIYVEGLTEYAVNNHSDCLTIMKRGERNRVIRQTTMNLKSSRSHTIFQLIIESNKADTVGALFKAKINLCDLAGSEKINKMESIDRAHLQELRSINQSLTTLGKVIQSLSHNSKNQLKLPVPFRESKITRLLQDSLQQSLTHIIVNVSCNIVNIDETANSLKFAQRARNIEIKVSQNKFNATDQVLVTKLMKEIDYLKSCLNMKRQGLNSNDIHFKLMKMQEENERLRLHALSVTEVEKLMQENRKMKEELQKLQIEGDISLQKYNSEDGFSDNNNTFQNNALLVVSNPNFQIQKTEVQVRFKIKGNKMQTKQGYVEMSDQAAQRERRLHSERKRVIERLEYLETLQTQNKKLNSSVPLYRMDNKQSKINYFSKPPLGSKHTNYTMDVDKSVRLRVIERTLI